MNRIIGLDVGNSKTVACVLTSEHFDKYPCPLKSRDFFLFEAEFLYLETKQKDLDRLIALDPDMVILEPTGRYSEVWMTNLTDYAILWRRVTNRTIVAARQLCGWKHKDDEHDAVALGYYGHIFKDCKDAFIEEKDGIIKKCYRAQLNQGRIGRTLTIFINQAKACLAVEAPSLKKTRGQNYEVPQTIWPWIAGIDVPGLRYTRKQLETKLKDDIGTAKEFGFSCELKQLALRIHQLQCDRAELYDIYHEVIEDPRFNWMYQVMKKELNLGVVLGSLLICQVYPFSKFLDESGKELRIKTKRRSKKGYPITKRVGQGKFIAAVGRGVFPQVSGDKEKWLVQGNLMCRRQWYLWAVSNLARKSSKSGTKLHFPPLVEELRIKYFKETQQGSEVLDNLSVIPPTELKEGWKNLREQNAEENGVNAILNAFEPLIDKAAKAKKPIDEKRGKAILGDWAKNRGADKAAKMLFKKLAAAYRGLDF